MGAQHLVEPASSVEQALVHTAGVSGAIPSGPLSLAVRVEGFTPARLDRTLTADRSVVRVPAMRGALYLLPTDLAADGLALARPDQFRPALVRAGMEEEAYDGLAASVESLLDGTPRTGTEIRRELGSERVDRDLPKGTFVVFLRGLGHEGRILRVGVRGGPQSQAFEYATTEWWLGSPLRVPPVLDGLVRLLPLYLDAHGPASLDDLAWWAGVTRKVARDALERFGPREVRLEGREEVLFASASEPSRETPAQATEPTLLPHWDPYLTAHVDRSRYLPERWHDRVIDRGGNSTNTVLVDGEVAGVWDFSEGVLAYSAFEEAWDRHGLHVAAHAVVPVLGELPLVERGLSPSLSGRGQNAFRAPLRGVDDLNPGRVE